MTVRRMALLLLGVCLFHFPGAGAHDDLADRRREAERRHELGNPSDAAALYRRLALDPANNPKDAAEDVLLAVRNMLRAEEADAAGRFLDQAAAAWPESWRVRARAAELLVSLPAAAGAADGGYGRPGGGIAAERDRAKAIRMLLGAEPLLSLPGDPPGPAGYADFYSAFAAVVATGRRGGTEWLFTALTRLDPPAGREEYDGYNSRRRLPAPVDADGLPIFYPVPAAWEAAANDGERWRWVLDRLARLGGERGRDEADIRFGDFLLSQFGVQTLAGQLARPLGDDDENGESGRFALRTLTDGETIARLASGVKRFALPDEFNPIPTFRRLAESADAGRRAEAWTRLASIYEDRRQYDAALAAWRNVPAGAGEDGEAAARAIGRILGKNGVIEPVPTAPAGTRVRLPYLFRNGEKVRLTALRLDEELLLADIRAALRAGRLDEPDAVPLRLENIGMLALEKNRERYVIGTAAVWDAPLEPPPGHRSRRVYLETPFSGAGAYLVTAEMEDGNVSRAVLWLADLALLHRTSFNRQIFHVADAVTGEPAAGADVSFLGYGYDEPLPGNRPRLTLREFTGKTDSDGLIVTDTDGMARDNWLITARDGGGRLACIGFTRIWGETPSGETEGRPNAFVITDRPAYRPDQTVRFKVWLGRAAYSARADAGFANQPVTVEIRDPMGELFKEFDLITDAGSGCAGELTPASGALLGQYGITVRRGDEYLGNGWFRLEEYRKPEFEVGVETPPDALALGDTARVTISARYHFGPPVADATVKYTVVRTPYESRPLPTWRWDWLYGAGAWRPGGDADWHPGWKEWGRSRPAPAWAPFRHFPPPELVAEGEGRLDSDGVFRLAVDTSPAKEFHGDRDQRYEITAEVTDRSRRVIVGKGVLLAARKPFSVAVWTDRGHYRAGQAIEAGVAATRPDGGGAKADGTATLYRIRYDADGAPHETELFTRDVAAGSGGRTTLRFVADEPGQYRLACVLADDRGRRVEGACIITVRGGEGGSGSDFRYAALELTPDRNEYQPGDTLELAVNSANRGAVVLLFPRAERNGEKTPSPMAAGRPIVLRLENGGRVVPLDIDATDQPNFFCEAVSIYDGRVHTEVREIFVPPADRTADLRVTPDAAVHRPGDKAAFTVKATGADGGPVTGQLVVAVYDKAVESIAGGSNVGDIRASFWSWKRYYSPMYASNLDRPGRRLIREGDVEWEPIGVFGRDEADGNDPSFRGVPAVSVMKTGFRMQVAPAPGGNGRMTRGSMLLEQSEPSPAPPPTPAAGFGAMADAMPGTGGDGMAAAAIRADFADSALWLTTLETDDDGMAEFTVDLPDNLAAWRARVWMMGREVRVGEGESRVETRKNIMIRPHTPRFLTQTDTAVLSATLHNSLPRDKEARVELTLEDSLLEPVRAPTPRPVWPKGCRLEAPGGRLVQTLTLPANGERRVDWPVTARRPGTARVIMCLLTDEESDAAEAIIPIAVHGARRVEAFSGMIPADQTETTLTFPVPAERLPEQSRIEFTFSPSLTSVMLETLPFLIEYPHGCTEQTLNRFLPAVMTRRALERLGAPLPPDAARAPAGRDPGGKSAEWLRRFGDRRGGFAASPVFDDAKLADLVKTGVERLAGMQNPDGGWGWFSGLGERSWPHSTAVVVHGLLAAGENGVTVPPPVLEAGIRWLRASQAAEVEKLKAAGEKGERARDGAAPRESKESADALDAFVHMTLAERGFVNADMRDFLYRDRLNLPRSGMVMLALALQAEKAADALAVVGRNLTNFMERDPDGQTAWLRTSRNDWWRWYNDDVETQAWFLKLLTRLDPAGADTAAVAKRLVMIRKNGAYWRSTRDSAYAIEALAEYAAASGETSPDISLSVYYDGTRVLERVIRPENLLDDVRFVLEGPAVETGRHEVRVVRSGTGRLYYSGALSLFSLEDPIAKAGGEIGVDRAFYKLVRGDGRAAAAGTGGQAAEVKTGAYRRVRIPSPFEAAADPEATIESGDLIEVEIAITARNECEYLVFEDMKAAGLEAVELVSGYSENRLGAYVEYRDQAVTLFIRSLPRGRHGIKYRFRAETPGAFSALPVSGGGMYATDLSANSDEMKIRIGEKEVFGE